MRLLARTMLVGAAVLALGMWLLVATSESAADDKGGTLESVQKLAEAIEKGDTAEAKKLVELFAKAAAVSSETDTDTLPVPALATG